jgi:hypothetical protein
MSRRIFTSKRGKQIIMFLQEKIEYIKGVGIDRKSMDRQYNGQRIRVNKYDIQLVTEKTS